MKHVKSALIYSFLLVLSACSNGLVGRWAGDCMTGSRMLVEFTNDNRLISQQTSCYGQQQGGYDPYGQQGGYNPYGQQGGYNPYSGQQQGYGGATGSYHILDNNRVSISGSSLNMYGNEFIYRVEGNRLTLSPSYGNSQGYGYGYGQQGGGYDPYGQQGGYNPYGQQGGYNPYGQQGGYNPYGQQGGYNPYGQQGYGNVLTFTRQN